MKSIHGGLAGNIWKTYFYTFLSSFNATEAIWMLFLAHRGMSLVQIGILEGIFHVTSLLMEVPTGIIADRIGRKFSRVLSRVAACAAALIMLSSHSFWLFAIAFFFTALGYNLESGAGDALVYDSLLELKREKEFMKVKGRQEIFYQLSHGLSILGGGIIATWSYNLAYALSVLLHLASLFFALSFVEARIGRQSLESAQIRISSVASALGAHVRDSFRALRGNGLVLAHMLFMEGFSLLYTTTFFYYQTFLKAEGWIEWQIGALLAAAAALCALMATQAQRLERALGQRRLVLMALPLTIVCYALIAIGPLGPGAMVALSAIEGLLFVAFSDYVNRLIPSAARATLLSFQSMLFSAMMIPFFPLLGALAQAHGYRAAFRVILASSFLLLGLGALLLGKIRPAAIEDSGAESR